jgi:hypothetical protein
MVGVQLTRSNPRGVEYGLGSPCTCGDYQLTVLLFDEYVLLKRHVVLTEDGSGQGCLPVTICVVAVGC